MIYTYTLFSPYWHSNWIWRIVYGLEIEQTLDLKGVTAVGPIFIWIFFALPYCISSLPLSSASVEKAWVPRIVLTQRRKNQIFGLGVLGVLAGIWIVEEVAFWVRSHRLGWEFCLKIWFLVLGVLVGISIVEETSRNKADGIDSEEILVSSVSGSAWNCRWHSLLICLVTYL